MSKRHVRPPHVIRLPKGCTSPTGSIYKQYDIVEQGNVLSTYSDGPNVVRSNKPFVLRVRVGRNIREIRSKLETK